jgi:SPP1 family predicted phage head-tail adaptor
MISDFYKQSITIQVQTSSTNQIGGQVQSWSTVSTVNGIIDLMSGGESKQGNKVTSESTHIMITDIGLNLDKDKVYRMSYGGRYYRVLFYDEPFGHHAEIYLMDSGVDN